MAARSTNFSVVRVKRDLLRRSSVGALFTGRREAQGRARQRGVRRRRRRFAFFENLAINTYWARPTRTGVSGDDTSYRGQLDYAGDRYGVQLERLVVGDHFNPGIGFVRRDDMRQDLRAVPVQPAAGASSDRAEVFVDRRAELRRERRGASRDARAERRVRDRVPERGPVQRRLRQHVRVPAGALPHRAGRDAAGRRLRLRQRADRLHARSAAAGLGQRLRRVRHLLQRPQDDVRRERAAG